MPAVLEGGRRVAQEIAGNGRILALLDAAYFEKQVVERLRGYDWDFIVCANQQRPVLRRLADEQGEAFWFDTGPETERGWSQSQVGCLLHLPENWSEKVTIVARRWREVGELPCAPWHYAFLASSIEPEALPASLKKRPCSYASAIWMLYGTKQGRESHYKTSLRDLSLHHPPLGTAGHRSGLLRHRRRQGQRRHGAALRRGSAPRTRHQTVAPAPALLPDRRLPGAHGAHPDRAPVGRLGARPAPDSVATRLRRGRAALRPGQPPHPNHSNTR